MSALDRSFIPSDVLTAAGSIEAGRRVLDTLETLPFRFREPVKASFFKAAEKGGQEGAIGYLSKVERELGGSALSLSASDGEMCDYARERANEVRSLLMAQTGASIASDMRGILEGYCIEFGATVPPGVTLAALVARMCDAAWWRRQVRRNMARKVEAHAIGLGFVHRRAGLYASDDAVKRHAEQQERNRAALEQTEATNEDGLTMTLAQLAAVGVSNPRIRRGELMTRIAGFEACAKAAGHVGMFYTGTAPSRMHPRLSASGQENPKFDGTTPRECAGYLSGTWAKARAWLHRRGISIYGFRVAEPHHDGTPHWHMLFFMVADAVESVTYCLRRYFTETDAHELSTPAAAKARFEAVKIDWSRGSAAGYISKYIAKNIDGQRNDMTPAGDDYEAAEPTSADKTAPRVLAWASTWGIRQFQQIGGPGVTVWRELRRLREMAQGDLFDTWSAADVGNWQEFTERQGGAICKRAARPVQLWREVPAEQIDQHGEIQPVTNKYGEPAGPAVKGVFLNRPSTGATHVQTKLHTWEIRRAGDGSAEGKQRGALVGSSAAVSMPVRRKLGATEMDGAKGIEGGLRRTNAGAGAGAVGFAFQAVGPWSPVNNCTPTKDADGFRVGEFENQEAAPPLPGHVLERVRAASRAAVLAGIESKRRRGGFGQFPRIGE